MSRGQAVQNAVTAILVICAILVTLVAIHAEFVQRTAARGTDQHIADWRALVAGRHPDMGSPNALLKIVEFSDYQCPFCRSLDPKLRALVNGSGGKVALIRYDLPLENIHPEALVAAVAAECAKLQGVYEPFQSKLFLNGPRLASLNWDAVAQSANIPDARAFSSCLSRKQTMPSVKADMAVAARYGFQSTPVMVIDGNVVMGTRTKADLDKVVAASLADR